MLVVFHAHTQHASLKRITNEASRRPNEKRKKKSDLIKCDVTLAFGAPDKLHMLPIHLHREFVSFCTQ